MDQMQPTPKSAVPMWAKGCWSGQAPYDKLKRFAHSEKYCELNASLHLPDPEYGYARGFHVAGYVLADHVIKTRGDLDVLVFPIVYTYRHHVELMLKRLILKGARLANVQLSSEHKKWLGKHRLDKLWEMFLPVIKAVAPLPSQAERGIRAYIFQLNLFDPEGQSSRYHVSSKGEASLAQLSLINVRVFVERMERLSCHLEGIDCQFNDKEELLNLKAEELSHLE
jgi:hypothetical protein